MYQEPQESPAVRSRTRSRTRGLRQVRRWSNWTAAALIAGTVVTTGYLARTSHPAAGTAGVAAAGVAGGQPGTAAGAQRPCVSVPVATSGGSGVTRQTVVPSCGTGTSAPVVVTTGGTHEGGDS